MERLLTLDEVSEMLRVPVNTLRYWRSAGTGPTSFRMGRRVMYSHADVEAFVVAQQTASRA